MSPSRRSDPPKTVLIVDDDPINLRATARHVSLAGFAVITTENPVEVPALALRHGPVAVVLDVTMRTLSGPEVADRLMDTPIIFYSGIDPVELAEIADGVPGARWVPKGDGLTALVRVLRSVVRAQGSGLRLKAGAPVEDTTYAFRSKRRT